MNERKKIRESEKKKKKIVGADVSVLGSREPSGTRARPHFLRRRPDWVMTHATRYATPPPPLNCSLTLLYH